jgi:hypothetical protein
MGKLLSIEYTARRIKIEMPMDSVNAGIRAIKKPDARRLALTPGFSISIW